MTRRLVLPNSVFPACIPFLSVQRVSYWREVHVWLRAHLELKAEVWGAMILSPDELVLNSENAIGSRQ